MKTCLADYCDAKAVGRGYCNKHYKRLRLHGDHKVITSPRNQARYYLENYVLGYDGDECLIWPFFRNGNGYGVISFGRKNAIVSRVVCEKIYGAPDSPKIEAAHSCGNGHMGCVNKRHLSWKTRSANQADRVLHGTDNRGSKAGASKLDEEDVLKIISLLPMKSQPEIARIFGVTQQSISKIATGQNWGWLTVQQGIGARA